ncbi:MAG TPA: 16S rRNA (guanine(527)-N(7))-methyltransferase RsmG [Vicinamibacterales bacterium]|nr:16S rRNA (guanine(527)-N(7))-methyltransferase RsmG [Vicinamibacterales bacterium]HOQ60933.1 16S rRNA (guanine(527)-N(7))-methyltransferase RsmG [Vicinamibacterales bacterium]HPK70658.1 16S rRNA (guanine(527)-N(7))-methyltransferase RsmG [Vicinamibacterales bacterium]
MTPREFGDRLAKRARRAGVALEPSIVESLAAYYQLLEVWNKKINLTAFPLSEGQDEAFDRLLIEPLVAAKHLQSTHGHGRPHGAVLGARPRLLDIGSGGGSPAIPMKLAIPSLVLTMVESKTRKSAFLREAVRQLGLADAAVETARAEDLLTRSDLHESQDLVTVRAVRVEQRLLVHLQAFLRLGGRVLLFRTVSGADTPPLVAPPFVYEATWTLVDSLRSRLVVLRKML